MSKKITNASVVRAIDYILFNLRNELTVENIASYCNISKYHFNRIFKEQTGESIYAFVKRLRVETSALRLSLEREQSITNIGMDYGYSSSNFSSAFSKHLSLSPAKFRKLKLENKFDVISPFDASKINYQSFEYYDKRITVNHLDDIQVVFNRYIGSYRNLRTLWPQFFEEHEHLRTENSRFIEISWNDPNITDLNRCLFDLCMTIDGNTNLVNTKMLEGGRVATYHFKGPAREINQTYKGLVNVWFPQSPYQPTGKPGFDFYISHCDETGDVEIDINLAIKSSTN